MPASAIVRATLAMGLSLALTACVVGPHYVKPDPEAPDVWSAPLPHAGEVDALASWWQQFDDPLLYRLIGLAESDSPSLTKAWANIEKARAAVTTARSNGLPTVSGRASETRSQQQGDSDVISESRSGGLDAAWELDLFGKVRRSTQAAHSRVDARVDDWHEARVSLAAEVASTYVQYRACELLSGAYARELESMEKTERAITTLVGAGFRAPTEGSLARASLASTRSNAILQQAQCDLLMKSLVALTGTEEPALRALLGVGLAKVPEPAVVEVERVPAEVLRQRPDLAALERALAAASAEIGVAQADLYPSLSLSGSIAVSAIDGGASATTWSFGPALSIPLFDGGRRRAAVDNARAGYTGALADYRQGTRNVVKEVEQALVNLDSAGRRVDDAATAAQAYREYLRGAEASWRAGRDSLITLEEARRNALSAEIQVLTLQRDRVLYWIALYKALGGGWTPGIPAVSPNSLAAPANSERGDS